MGSQGPRGLAGDAYGERAAAFAGFTTTLVTGALGSREQMHARCAAAFTGAHLCHDVEYQLAHATTPVPANGAWIDASAAADGAYELDGAAVTAVAATSSGRLTSRHIYMNCASWTTTSTSSGAVLSPGGVYVESCYESHVLACCSTPYAETFRGLTPTAYNGNAGGRAVMHARCAAAYAGSHLCHAAEYDRAHATTIPPVNGAWLDASGFASPDGGTVATGVAGDPSTIGRWTSRHIYDNCENWTTLSSTTSGTTIRPGLTSSQSCSFARPLACCGG